MFRLTALKSIVHELEMTACSSALLVHAQRVLQQALSVEARDDIGVIYDLRVFTLSACCIKR